MKIKILLIIAAIASLVSFPSVSYAQVINLGTAADFVLFTTNGAVTNVGITHLTGHVGSNVGGSTGFGNVDGVMHDQDPASAQATIDLNIAYLELDAALSTNFPGVLLGGGMTLVPGVHTIPAAATMNGELNLDAQGDPNAVFIIQVEGALGIGTNAEVKLINDAQACNVYWKVDGAVSIASDVTMKGTIVAYNDFITMNAGDLLEGRALSINGAISVTATVARTPLACLAPTLTGPANPDLLSTECFALFSAFGSVINAGATTVTGDIGSNSESPLGYNPLLVTGTIHALPDAFTVQCATDQNIVYNNINTLPEDIELLYPAQFGNDLVLTPHVYLMNTDVTFTDALYLNAQGNPDAVFVFKIAGALSTSTFSNVILMNGAQAENVYWVVSGDISISDNSTFNGSILSQGAIDLATGVTFSGRALTGMGAVSTSAMDVVVPTGCSAITTTEPIDVLVCDGESASFTVIAEGIGLTYQWRRGLVNLIDAGNISGATTATLTINPASVLDVAADYNVIITGTFPPADTSNFASLTLDTAPVITTEPSDVTVCIGESASFTVVASGLGNTYQWRKGLVDLVDGASISGATTPTLVIDPTTVLDGATDYNVLITGTCLPDTVSMDVSLTVQETPAITVQPINDTVCVGESASFTVGATGVGITYQWRQGLVDLVDGAAISGATTPTLIIDPTTLADGATDYNVLISGTCLPDVVSVDVSLTVDEVPVITIQPMDTAVCLGESVSFTAIATGTVLTYQWRRGLVDLVDGGNISGVTTATLTIDPTTIADGATDYNLIVSGVCSPEVVSSYVTLTIEEAPVVTLQPINDTVCLGDAATFTVVSSGAGLTYQWRQGLVDLVDGGAISGATTATITIDPTTLLDAGTDYNVVISGSCLPDVISSDVSLTIEEAPAITIQPTSTTVCLGEPATFTVTATGTDITYQWRNGLVDLVDGASIAGATTATLTIDPTTLADAGTDYNVIVSGTCTPEVVSTYATLTIEEAPAIATQPTDVTVCLGESATFTVVASGAGLTYQWRQGLVDLINNASVSGATTATLTIDPTTLADGTTDYNVVVSGSCLPDAISVDVSLIIEEAPVITTQPTDATVCLGEPATFTVVASGAGLSYQWRNGIVNLIDGITVSGATTSTLTIDPATFLDAGTDYNVVITGSCMPDAVSVNVSLTIEEAPAITTQPTDVTVCLGEPATFTVAASGAGLTYQWRNGLVDLVDGASISGATTATLTIDPTTLADAGIDYYVVVSGSCLPDAISMLVSLTIEEAPVITTQPTDVTVCLGDAATFTVVASGAGLTYQWRNGLVDLVDGGSISGATTSSLMIDPTTLTDGATDYNVIITGTCMPDVVSVDVTLTIEEAPVITTQPTDVTVCLGEPATFTVVSTGGGLTYQWRNGLVDLVDGASISGATTATLTIDPTTLADAGIDYNVVIIGSCAPDVTSVNVTLTIEEAPVITTQPVDVTVCLGEPATFTVVASGAGLSYQWRNGLVDLVDGASISGATTATLTIDPTTLADAGTDYNVVVSGSCLPDAISMFISLTIEEAPVITTQPIDAAVCLGEPATFTVVASGAGLSYQWRQGLVDLIDGVTVSGATTATLTIDPVTLLDVANDYNVVITGSCLPDVTSVDVSLSIEEPPVITTQPTDVTVCLGEPATFTVVATGAGLTYQWRNGLVDLVDGGSISGATTATLTIDPTTLADAGIDYYVVVSGTCLPDVISTLVSLTIEEAPVIITQPADVTVCLGEPATFTVTATGTGLTYQWRNGLVDLVDGGSISGATTATLTIDPTTLADAGTDYNVIVSGSCSPDAVSVNVSLTIEEAPVITTQPVDATVCLGDAATFTVVATGGGLTYQWRNGLIDLVDGGSISGATTATLTIDPTTLADAGTDYNVVVSGSCAPDVTSVNVSLTIEEAPVITTQPTDVTVCLGESATFTVTATGTGITYQWRNGLIDLVDGGSISGATTATLTIDPTTLADAGTDYNVVVSGSCLPDAISVNVSLIIEEAPVITTQPTDEVVCLGDAATFTVVASGAGLTYQWRQGLVDLVDGVTISGATTSTLTIDPTTLLDAGTDYNVVITGSCLPDVISIDVSLTFEEAPVITTQPTDVTVCLGEEATFTVTASGTSLTYQWRQGLVDLVDGGSISGATTATLTIDPTTMADAGTDYNVVVSGACSLDATSVDVSLTIEEAPVITTQPTDVTVCLGEPATFTVTATGTGITYQWRQGLVDLVDGASISGATTSTLTIDPTTLADAGTDYNVVVSGACSPDAVSVNVTLTIEEAPVITTQPADATVCLDEPATFAVVASGAGLTYQWRRGLVNLVDGASISGATTATLTIDPTTLLDVANDYNVVVSGLCAPDVTSDDVALAANVCLPDVSVVKTASSMTPIVGENVEFTITANNLGETDVTGAQVEDILQSGYTYVSSDATIGTYDPVTGVWNIGDLSIGDSETLTIVATVNRTGDHENTAEITINEFELDVTNNVSTILLIPSDFFIPEGFSPNGDMVNDEFVIPGILEYPSNELTVFNRWGNIVFSAKPYQNTWDGKSGSDFNIGGDILPVGTYFYVLDLGDGSTVHKGTIYLNN